MGEKANLVIGFPRAILGRRGVDWAYLTSQLSQRVLQALPRHWVAVREFSERTGAWPLSPDEISLGVASGEIIAVYPREDGSSVDGAIVWCSGEQVGTVTVAIPVERVGEIELRSLAVTAMELAQPFGAVLCAVGSELELNDDDQLDPSVLLNRRDVEIVAFFREEGVVVLGPSEHPE